MGTRSLTLVEDWDSSSDLQREKRETLGSAYGMCGDWLVRMIHLLIASML
jgi:hypothetical protein